MNSAFSLHGVFADHMVLQRDKPIRISGTASPRSSITATFLGRVVSAETGLDGNWLVEFPPSPAGGPYEMTISHACHPSARIVLHDILIGDVWFCSGQSNMEYPVWGQNPFFRLQDGLEVAAAAHDDGLRLFQIPLCVEVDGPCTEPPGRPAWKPATTAEAVKEFSAVGYWFGDTIRKALDEKVPIGLIHSSWGGTLIEPWISEDSFRRAGRQKELALLESARALKFDDAPLREYAMREFTRARDELKGWIRDKFLVSDPAATADALASWALPDAGPDGWTPADARSISSPGIVWFRCEFDLPESLDGYRAIVHIDSVNDCDETFLDGEKIGATSCDAPNYWAIPRNYPANLAPAAGRHVLAIRAMDHFSTGGVNGAVTITVDDNGVSRVFDLILDGRWSRRTEFTADSDRIGIRPNVPNLGADPRNSPQTPATLFNAMVNPFLPAAIKGVIWYQGCSNAGNPADYLFLQRLWIEDWRRAWNDDTLPFLITQLAAFNGHHPDKRLPDDFWKDERPGDNPGFAPLREVQDALRHDRGVGVACTIDIGDHSDIHPDNKKDVGIRLAHEALRLSYGRADAIPGPRFRSAVREGGALRIAFDDIGGGLVVRGGAIGPHLFAIAGEDQRFVWADTATLCDDGTVLVSSAAVPEPVHVQYAFSAFPPAPALYRIGDNLPVFPFRTNLPDYLTEK